MADIPEPTQSTAIPDALFQNADRTLRQFGLPDKVWVYAASSPDMGPLASPSAPEVIAKYPANCAPGMSSRETTEPILRRIGTRTPWTVTLPLEAVNVVKPNHTLRMFIKDRITGDVVEHYPVQIVAILKRGTFAWKFEFIAAEGV